MLLPTIVSAKKENPCTLDSLLDGETDLGYGVTLSPILSKGRLAGIQFSHEIWEDEEWRVGVCKQILPIRRRGTRQFTFDQWRIRVSPMYPGLTLSPSVWCTKHGVHGWIENGAWVPSRRLDFPPLTYEQARILAEREADRRGGGYEGAIDALTRRIQRRRI